MGKQVSPLEVLTNALEGAKNGTLIVPKVYANITQDDGNLIRTYGITKIMFEKGSALKFVDTFAFAGNPMLEEVDFSNCKKLTIIAEKAFLGANALKKVVFAENNNLKKIGQFAFCRTALSKINFNNSALEIIGNYAFFQSKQLEVLDMSKCKNLKYVGTGVTLGDLRLKLWDMSGSDKIQTFLPNGTYAEAFRINANLRSNGQADFYQTLLIGHLEIWDNGQMVDKFLMLESMGDDSIIRLNVLKTGYMKDLKRLGYKDVSTKLINRFEDQAEFKIYLKNKSVYDEIVDKLNVNQKFSSGVWVMLKVLGYAGFGDASQKDILEYRRLLARDMLYYKNFGLGVAQGEKIALMTEDEKSVFDQEINILAQKIAQKSRDYPLEKLVEIFVKNNVVGNCQGHKLVFEFESFEKSTPKLEFAKFLVLNFHEIMAQKVSLNDVSVKRNVDFTEYQTLAEIYKNFDILLADSNKMVVTRLANQRFGLKDCERSILENCHAGNEDLLRLCERAGIDQTGFDCLQMVFEEGKKIAHKQILKCREDSRNTGVHYEMIYKDNPLGLVLGNITNCCQRFDQEMVKANKPTGWDCVLLGQMHPQSTFVAFKKDDRIIAQAWLWYNEENKTIGIDNIEVPENMKKIVNQTHAGDFALCIDRLAKNLFEDMNASGFDVKNVIIGAHATDVSKLDELYPKENFCDVCLSHNFDLKGWKAYTDAVLEGQYFVYKNGELMKKSLEKNQEK